MALSSVKVDIWNKALRRIGHTQRIEDESDESLEAVICEAEFDDCLAECLERRPWLFATRQALASTLALATARVGWEYAYALPVDFVAARAVLTGGQRFSLTPGESRIPYELQSDDTDTGYLLCTDYEFSDDEEEVLEYTYRVTNISRLPRGFVSAVAWRLAAELALALEKGADGMRIAQACLSGYESSLSVAFAAETNSGRQDDPELDAPSIRARE